jgi:hypothetical protein
MAILAERPRRKVLLNALIITALNVKVESNTISGIIILSRFDDH